MNQHLAKRALLWAGIVLSASSAPLSTQVAQAGLLQTVDFEDGGASLGNANEIEGPTANVANSTAFARRGTHSLRAQIYNADKRAEVVSNKRGTVGGENWYGWSIYIPADFGGDTTRDIVSQFHDWHRNQPAWAKDGTAPTCFVLETNGKLIFSLKYDYPTGDNDPEHSTFDLGAYTKGAWHDIVMHVKWTHQTTGFCKIWVNGVQKLDYTGSTYLDYGTGNGPYFKAGDYKGIYNWNGTAPRTLYFDEFRMGDAASNYEEVDPAPTLVDIEAAADASVRPSSFQNVNYGNATTLNVQDDPNVKYDWQSYLRFDMTAHTGAINSAKLILTPASLGANVALSSFEIRLVADDTWQENVITWANKPASSTYIANIPVTGLTVGQAVEVDVTSIAQAQKTADGKLSIAIVPTTLGSDRFANFKSYEAGAGMPILRLE